MNPRTTLSVLIAEDDAAIHHYIKAILGDLGYAVVHSAYDGPEAVALAEELKPDVILMDLVMPDPESGREDRQAGLRATEAILRRWPAPIIWLTAHESPELVAQAGQLGVSAYLVKPPRANDIARAMVIAHARFADLQELRRLNAALETEITERRRAEEALRKTNAELQAALAQVKTLSGLLPICSSCKKIRDDRGYWRQVESYISQHTDVRFSHSFCPECMKKHFPDLYNEIYREGESALS